MQGFTLVLARSDGRLGERLRRSDSPCEPPQRPTFPRCGQDLGSDYSFRMNSLPLSMLVAALRQRVDAPVTDRTGLAGDFVLELEWTPDRRPGAAGNPPDDSVSLVTALREQLGLKLQREKVDVDVVVIDGVERPTAD